MTAHRLKVWPELYEDVAAGRKTFELRRRTPTDPPIEVGDRLQLAEWTRAGLDASGFTAPEATGRTTTVIVTYVITAEQLAELGLDMLQPDVMIAGIQPEPARVPVAVDGERFTTEGWVGATLVMALERLTGTAPESTPPPVPSCPSRSWTTEAPCELPEGHAGLHASATERSEWV